MVRHASLSASNPVGPIPESRRLCGRQRDARGRFVHEARASIPGDERMGVDEIITALRPLWFALDSHYLAALAHETLRRCGANTEIGLDLHQMFQEAGFAPPTMRMEILLGSDREFTRWIYDLLSSLHPQIPEHNQALELLGDFNTLPQRLHAEVAAAHTVVPFVGLVGAWSRRPEV